MKKTLKLVGIFIGVVLIAVTGGLGGYFLISKNKTYYINDLRIVEPKENQSSYVYTNSKAEYKTIKNKAVFMTSKGEDFFEIGIYAYTSTNTKEVNIYSTDTSIAKIVYRGKKCYVKYMKAGVTDIVVELGGVKDKITLTVYNNIVDDLIVHDNKYYGEEYSKIFANELISYSDGKEYRYDFKVKNIFGEDSIKKINKDSLKVTKFNKEVFEDVYIDGTNQQLVVICKKDLVDTVTEDITITSTYDNGPFEEHAFKSFKVQVKVVAYTPEFLQVVMSTNPDFTNDSVFVNTIKLNKPEFIEDKQELKVKLENYLSYQKAEKYLNDQNENAVYKTFFNEKINRIYLKFRKVYTNGDIVYLNRNTFNENPYTITSSGDYLKLAYNKEYYTLDLDNTYFQINQSYDINLKLNDYDLNHTFKFEYASLNAQNLADYYDYDKEKKVFTYKYWDPRAKYDDVITNENGEIIGFAGIVVDLTVFD